MFQKYLSSTSETIIWMNLCDDGSDVSILWIQGVTKSLVIASRAIDFLKSKNLVKNRAQSQKWLKFGFLKTTFKIWIIVPHQEHQKESFDSIDDYIE